MATPDGRAHPPLAETLREEPYRFDFFQAVRLLERLHPDRATVGGDGPPSAEVARFLVRLGLGFPASAIERVSSPETPGCPPGLTVNFLGLTGPSGVLPYPYTELLEERARKGDTTLAAFLDVFNHRLISLFYRAWEKSHVFVAHERGEGDRLANALFSLIGLGQATLRDRHEFSDDALLAHSGTFARRQRPAIVLEGLLRDLFRLPVEVHQFQGRWLRLDPGDRSIVGASGVHNALGMSLVVGERVWDEPGKFRLRLGPLSFEEFLAYLPDGREFLPLSEMTRMFVDGEFDFDIQLVLKAEEVPACRLSSALGQGAKLGRYAWLTSRRPARDVDDAVFEARA